jgi:hypothetical protein
MIRNEYHLEQVEVDLARWRTILVELESMLSTLPRAITAQVSPHRPETIRRRIRELETEIREYLARRQAMAATSASR